MSTAVAARSDLQALRRLILTWRKDPVTFVRQVFEVEPEPWQAERLARIAQGHRRQSIRSGHGVGKTTLLAWLILWFMTTRYPVKVPCTAPTGHQLSDILWAELGKWLRKMPQVLQDQFELKTDKLVLVEDPDNSFAVARTARKENPEALQGFHSDNLMFIIDEASGVDEAVFEVAEGALSTRGAYVIMTSNPTRTSGYFYDSHHRMREFWDTAKVSCFDSSRVDPAYIERARQRYGEDSNIYRVRVLGEFPTADDDTVMPLELVLAATQREDVDPSPGRVLWGLDVARFGDDRTALAKRRANRLLEPVRTWTGKDLMQTVGRVVDEYNSTPAEDRPEEILVDVIGMGSGVVDRLLEQGLPVTAVNVAEAPSIGDKYARLRDELWFRGREWFESRAVWMPEDDELVAELTTPTFKFTSTGKIKVESKDEMKKRGFRSPDKADAFLLTFASNDAPATRIKYQPEGLIVPGSWMGA